MAWIKLNNVYMNSTSSSSSSTSTYTYTTTTAASIDRYTTTYNNTLSSGTSSRYIMYYVMSETASYNWESCPYSGDNFTIGSRGMSVSISKNATLTSSNNSYSQSIMYNKYATLSAESSYNSFSSDSNSSTTSWNKEVMCYDSLIELEESNTYSISATAGTFSKTINDFFKKNCTSWNRSMQNTVSLIHTYTFKSKMLTGRYAFTTTVTVGYGTNTHTESYEDKRYTDSVYFTQSLSTSYCKHLIHWTLTRFTENINTSTSCDYYDTYMATLTTSYCRTSTILTNTTVPSITTVTSTR